MRRAYSLCSRSLHQSRFLKLNPNHPNRRGNNDVILRLPLLAPLCSKLRFFSSSENDSSKQNPDPNIAPGSESKLDMPDNNKGIAEVEDVDNKEMKQRLDKYLRQGDEEALPSIVEAVFRRGLTGKHEETDDELADELQMSPLDGVNDKEFDSDFDDVLETDEEIDDLYNARDIVTKRMASDEFFNMDDRKWDEMVKEGIEHGFLKDTKECEEILEDMLNWDKLLPDEIKEKLKLKYNEIDAMVENNELSGEEGYKLYKEFEDQMIVECAKLMEAEEAKIKAEGPEPDKGKDLDDPPGEGPILRWQSRMVFSPGGDAWHPKNRKVKLSVTVKELGLSKHQFRRLRELVGKRYNPGKDELTITSERFEHREENRKDCLRTLYALIEECGKARMLVEDARTSSLKEKLKSNPNFMGRLNEKVARDGELSQSPA